MPTTSVYGLPYQGLTDQPHGPDLGQDLAEAVETELARIDAAAAAAAAKVQSGSQNVVFSSSNFATATITFAAGFTAAPRIACQVVSAAGAAVGATVLITAISSSSATVRVDLNVSSTVTLPVHWIARQS